MDAALYSEALEQQLALVQWWGSQDALAYAEELRARALGTRGITMAAPDICRAMQHELLGSTPYYVSSDICAVLEASATTLPSAALHVDLLPTAGGVMYFADPLPLPDLPDYVRPDLTTDRRLRAISWEPYWQTFPTEQERAGDSDPEQGEVSTGISVTYYEAHAEWQRPLVGSQESWPWGESWDGWTVVGEDGAAPPFGERERRYAMAAWLWMGQRILRTLPMQASRGTRRRAARHYGDQLLPVIQVVVLRRTETVSPLSANDQREWHCRWVVSGYWREQPCGPGRVTRRPTWVLPHVKGPADKPLKPPSTKVFAVVR